MTKYVVTVTVHTSNRDDAVGIAKLALTSLVIEGYTNVSIMELDDEDIPAGT